MFKKESRTWLYMIGILIMFGILLTIGREIYIPFIYGTDPDTTTPDITQPSFDINRSLNYYADIETNYGVINIDLAENSAPLNVNNFVYLATKGYYINTKFHRLISDFLIQGGDRNTLNTDPDDDGKGYPGYTIQDEINWDSLDLSQQKRDELSKLGFSNTNGLESIKLDRYTIAMANDGPNTNGSQFFIVIADFDDPRLDSFNGQFTVIGRIVGGFDTINTIKQIQVDDPKAKIPRPQNDIVVNNINVYTR